MNDSYKNIPKTVRIGCYSIDVLVGTYEDHEQEGSYGHMNSFRQRISVRPGMSRHKLANTFIHEVLHAIHWVYGLMPAEDRQLTEEDFTELTANGLCAFWQDNPKACTWWAKLTSIETI
jgi:hypothetical protein